MPFSAKRPPIFGNAPVSMRLRFRKKYATISAGLFSENHARKTMSERKSCFRGCLLYGGIAFLMLAVSFWYFCLYAPPFVISEATTWITEPLTADGQIDYFKALEERIYPPELATDENGYRIFVRLFGYAVHVTFEVEDDLIPTEREFYRLQLYEKLGLDPNVPPTLTLPEDHQTVLKKFYESKGEEIPWDYVLRIDRGLWTLEEYPMLADWINELDEPLNAIAEAVRKPVFVVPLLQRSQSVLSGEPQYLAATCQSAARFSHTLSRLLHMRAAYRLGQGDIDGAIDDKLTLHRLGRQLSHAWHHARVGLEGTAQAIPINANPEHPLTAAQIRRILDTLDALPPHPPIEEYYTQTRLTGLSVLQNSMCSPTAFDTIGCCGNMRVLVNVFCDWNVAFRRMNEIYDAMAEPPPRAKYNSMVEAIENQRVFSAEFFLRMLTAQGRGMNHGNVFPVFLTEVFSDPGKEIQTWACSGNLHRLAWAVLLYQLEHGEMPDENWTAQLAPYLGENPAQYFSCPANPSPEGKTSYALVRYGDEVSEGSVLFVELAVPVPFDEAVISYDEVLEGTRTGGFHGTGAGYRFAAYRSGAVLLLPNYMNEEELLRSLERSE